ncbi:MAG: HslU--HslV peptidase ATPase subunit, partial [Novosphingobium sp.]
RTAPGVKSSVTFSVPSGAFHVAKPSDMLPELQGRLPIRVELSALSEDDFVRILSETRANLVEQYRALLGTEKVSVDFTPEAVREVARIAAQVNESVENIGARRLQTVMEKLLEELSFEAEDRQGETVMIDEAYVSDRLAGLARDTDLSKYIL